MELHFVFVTILKYEIHQYQWILGLLEIIAKSKSKDLKFLLAKLDFVFDLMDFAFKSIAFSFKVIAQNFRIVM
jgi:hypothetical protein